MRQPHSLPCGTDRPILVDGRSGGPEEQQRPEGTPPHISPFHSALCFNIPSRCCSCCLNQHESLTSADAAVYSLCSGASVLRDFRAPTCRHFLCQAPVPSKAPAKKKRGRPRMEEEEIEVGHSIAVCSAESAADAAVAISFVLLCLQRGSPRVPCHIADTVTCATCGFYACVLFRGRSLTQTPAMTRSCWGIPSWPPCPLNPALPRCDAWIAPALRVPKHAANLRKGMTVRPLTPGQPCRRGQGVFRDADLAIQPGVFIVCLGSNSVCRQLLRGHMTNLTSVAGLKPVSPAGSL